MEPAIVTTLLGLAFLGTVVFVLGTMPERRQEARELRPSDFGGPRPDADGRERAQRLPSSSRTPVVRNGQYVIRSTPTPRITSAGTAAR